MLYSAKHVVGSDSELQTYKRKKQIVTGCTEMFWEIKLRKRKKKRSVTLYRKRQLFTKLGQIESLSSKLKCILENGYQDTMQWNYIK